MSGFLLNNAVWHAREYLAQTVKEGDRVIDATAGNGHDTVFLADLVGKSGKVFAFDIQSLAIRNTRERLEKRGLLSRVKLILSGHENIEKEVKERVSALVFNLGYLPGYPKGPVTCFESLKIALNQGLKILKKGGIVSITAYPGHIAGKKELRELLDYVSEFPQKEFSVAHFRFLNQRNDPPELILIEKIK